MKGNTQNIVFITTTQYQFLISDIYARYIYDKFGVRSKVVYRQFEDFELSKFDTEGKYDIIPYVINNKKLLGQCKFALQCGYLFPFTGWGKLIEARAENILFVYNDMSKLTYRLIECAKKENPENKVIIVEEGISTYSDSMEVKNDTLWKFKHMLSKVLFGIGRKSKVEGDNPLIDYAIVRDPDRYKRLIKAQSQKVIQQNKNILMAAKCFLSHYSGAIIRNVSYDAIYLGQPFYKNGLPLEAEDKCIAEIMECFPRESKIMIKPHPRDAEGKYDSLVRRYANVSLIDGTLAVLPIETMMEYIEVKSIIAVNSTAAVTLADLYPNMSAFIMFELPCVKEMEKQLVDAGQEVFQHEESIFKGRNGNIYIPKTNKEFAELFKRIQYSNKEAKDSLETFEWSFPEIDMIIRSQSV